jgi:hypothetical protein
MIIEWNKEVTTEEDYLTSSEGMQKMAASCMLIESIGEGVKKIDKIVPNLLSEIARMYPGAKLRGYETILHTGISTLTLLSFLMFP